MTTSSKEGKSRVLVEQEDREAVLSVITASSSVTIEELLHHLPWMRWGYLFSILGECLKDESVVLYQHEFHFEVRAISSTQTGSDKSCSGRPCSVNTGRLADGNLTHS